MQIMCNKPMIYLVLSLLCIATEPLNAQTVNDSTSYVLKTNILGWATTSMNLAGEIRLDEKYTLNLALSYNPFVFGGNRQWRHILVQPEARWWTDRAFNGHFFGVHLLYSHYNAGNVNLPFGLWKGLETYRYQGDLFGGGIAYGYQWRLSDRWRMEASVGIGYAYTNYKKYECHKCGPFIGEEGKSFVMPSKAALSVIYVIK